VQKKKSKKNTKDSMPYKFPFQNSITLTKRFNLNLKSRQEKEKLFSEIFHT